MARRKRRRKAELNARPTVVTLLSILTGFSAVYSVWLVWSGRLVFPGLYLVFEIAGILCMGLVAVGLWKMKRWAVWVYAAICLAAIPLAISRHKWKWAGVPVPLIALGLMCANYRRMK
jgi:hypothetical protein